MQSSPVSGLRSPQRPTRGSQHERLPGNTGTRTLRPGRPGRPGNGLGVHRAGAARGSGPVRGGLFMVDASIPAIPPAIHEAVIATGNPSEPVYSIVTGIWRTGVVARRLRRLLAKSRENSSRNRAKPPQETMAGWQRPRQHHRRRRSLPFTFPFQTGPGKPRSSPGLKHPPARQRRHFSH